MKPFEESWDVLKFYAENPDPWIRVKPEQPCPNCGRGLYRKKSGGSMMCAGCYTMVPEQSPVESVNPFEAVKNDGL